METNKEVGKTIIQIIFWLSILQILAGVIAVVYMPKEFCGISKADIQMFLFNFCILWAMSFVSMLIILIYALMVKQSNPKEERSKGSRI